MLANEHNRKAQPLLTGIFMLFIFFTPDVHAHGPISLEVPVIDVSKFPPIEDDIQALASFSMQAKSAGLRLIERGDEILPVAHGVLADANATYEQRMQLIYILGEIAYPESATELIQSIKSLRNNRYLYQNALLALAKFEPTDEITAFVDAQLDITKRDPLLQRSALNYYAQHPGQGAEKWIKKYALNPDANPEVRYAALYMAGMNGVAEVKEPIMEALGGATNTIREYYILLGLANVSTKEEFNNIVNTKKLDPDNVKKAYEFLEFRLTSENERKTKASDYLNSKNSRLKQAAVTYFVDAKNAEALASNWQQGDSFVRGAVKRAGYEISGTDAAAQLTPIKHPDKGLHSYWYLLTLVVLVLLSAVLFKLKSRS